MTVESSLWLIPGAGAEPKPSCQNDFSFPPIGVELYETNVFEWVIAGGLLSRLADKAENRTSSDSGNYVSRRPAAV